MASVMLCGKFVSILSWIHIYTDGEKTEVEVNCRGVFIIYCSSDTCTTEKKGKKQEKPFP